MYMFVVCEFDFVMVNVEYSDTYLTFENKWIFIAYVLLIVFAIGMSILCAVVSLKRSIQSIIMLFILKPQHTDDKKHTKI
jgi:hypothetical protein